HLVHDRGLDPDVAVEVVWRSNVFTTHTPVPAGNEVFDIGLVRPYLEAMKKDVCVDVDRFINWGVSIDMRNKSHEICMTILGLRMSNYSNGVSQLHGHVAREMWKHLWPGRKLDEIPITHITNGVHLSSWIAERNKIIYDHYLNPDWLDSPGDAKVVESIDNIPDEELWYAHEMCRQSLVRQARQRFRKQFKFRNIHVRQGVQNKNLLSDDVLTVGFARRFATYKRATLLLRDKERLKALLTDPKRPIQLIFAGKAHPADDAGKSFIQQIIQFAENENLSHRLVFLEDYDIGLARYLVQGVDVWLNTPARPQEASGTSGMKASINGVLNCSILDGWWDEAYRAHRNAGWAITSGELFDNVEERDSMEAQVLFHLLENEIIPCFYDRAEGDIPIRWVKMMKEAIKMGIGKFSSGRMVAEYNSRFYGAGVSYYEELMADNAAAAVRLVQDKNRFIKYLGAVKVVPPTIGNDISNMHVGDSLVLHSEVFLGELSPDEVDVEIYYGPVDAQNNIVGSNSAVMKQLENKGNGSYIYECVLDCRIPGRFGLTARVKPCSDTWEHSVPGFVKWAEN
ncbi:MAG: alpha-glucan family phosphorylase, partial [Victivallales bacterium]|nr:alpha-glucan family phosphorylase [Victivallales bacterium]